MKKLRISYKSFEKSLDKFVERRILGVGFQSPFDSGFKSDVEESLFHRPEKAIEPPLCFQNVDDKHYFSQLMENDKIREAKKKLVLSYKGKPFSKKSGYSIEPANLFEINYPKFKTIENPIRNFLLSWNFDENFLYFKFFVRFKNGHKNIRCRQMKIKWQNVNLKTDFSTIS
jgi:hypothetical protein